MKDTSEFVLELDPSAPAYASEKPFQLVASIGKTSKVQPPISVRTNGSVVGILSAFDGSGMPRVDFTGNKSNAPIAARSIIALTPAQIGSEVLILFEQDDSTRPIIVGCIQVPASVQKHQPVEVKVDGEQLVFTAKKEIVLRCGKSSITLTRAGKVLIRGAYLLSRSSGVNRIKGGSVQIN